MCGIAGIIDKRLAPISKESISRITNKASYRGPDGEGYFFDNNLALGHRRLSIIDLSPMGQQPMSFADKYFIVYNGEVYNYIEIRHELKSLGYIFRTNTDTEVLLASYDKWGEDCVHKFNGMWAFAIYDKVKNILFCSRDRFGVKPFYYLSDNIHFAFGSEINQLLELKNTNKVNYRTLINYIVLSFENYSEDTFFDNIKELPSSHNLIYKFESNTYEIKKYYRIRINSDVTKLSFEEALPIYFEKLRLAVQYRLRSDVKVGTCLSGGLDSSTIAALASLLHVDLSDEKFCAITAQSSDEKIDESEYAKQVVAKSNLQWICTRPNQQDYKTFLSEVIRTQQEPFGGPSIFMQYFVFAIAKANEIKVLLDGQGGDESLLGYERYYPAFLLSLPFNKKIQRFASMVTNSRLSIKELLAYHFYFTHSGLRIRRQLRNHSFIKPHYLELIDRGIVNRISDSYKDVKAMQIMEFTTSQLPPLLRYEDRNSMRNSVESRLPFLDYNLVEFSLSLNDSFKIRDGWTKYILRHAANSILPQSIAWRKSKIGFEAPVKHWLNDFSTDLEVIKKSNIINEIGGNLQIKNPPLKLYWKLLNIALWEKEFNVSA